MIVGLLWVVFILSTLFLGLIILIQEGKGGGLAEAFGGMGQETFGVGTKGVNRVTAILATVFLASAILINRCSYQTIDLDLASETPASDVRGAGGAEPPAGGAGDEGG